MKKLTALLLALVLLLSLAACGEGTKNNETKPVDNTDSPAVSQEETEQTAEPSGREITFTELTAVDNEECAITVTGIEPDNIWGYTIKALLENKSAEKTYMFSVDSAAINGVQCDPFFAAEVAPGKKANKEISFSTDELEENGITEFTDIELTFRVYDSEDWSADDVAMQTVHIYPFGEDQAAAFVRQPQDSDTVLVDNDAATVIVTGYAHDDIWGYTVKLFLINKTDKNLMFTTDEASVNGFMADPFFATTILAGKCAFKSVSWSDETFEENGISEVETIEFLLRAYDSDDWTAEDLVNEAITLNP